LENLARLKRFVLTAGVSLCLVGCAPVQNLIQSATDNTCEAIEGVSGVGCDDIADFLEKIDLARIGALIFVQPGDEITIPVDILGLVSFARTPVEILINGNPVEILSSTDDEITFIVDKDDLSDETSILEVIDKESDEPVARYALATAAAGTPFSRMIDLADIAPLAGPVLTTPGAIMDLDTDVVTEFALAKSKFEIFVGGISAKIVQQNAGRVRFEVPNGVAGVVPAELVDSETGEVLFVFLLDVRPPVNRP
jgi:hypothetical protein